MGRDMLYRGQSSHRRFETLLGKIAFASQFSTEARLRSHEFANPQLIASEIGTRFKSSFPRNSIAPYAPGSILASCFPLSNVTANSRHVVLAGRFVDRLGLDHLHRSPFFGLWSTE